MGKIHNKFEFYTQKVGESMKHVGHAENVVLDRFYNNLAAMMYSNDPDRAKGIGYIALGSGTNTPSSTDTKLTNYYNAWGASRTYVGYNAEQDYYEYQYKVTLSPITAVGKIFTEVGLATDNADAYVVTKALITDNLGNPISIEKKETESLVIVATLYISDSQFVEPEIRPASYWLPQWVEEKWQPEYNPNSDIRYVDWTSKPHQKISNAQAMGTGTAEDRYSFSFCPDIFKGLSQIPSSISTSAFESKPRFGKSVYLSVNNGQSSAEGVVPTPKLLTLNTGIMNMAYGLTSDIYKIIWSIHNSGDMGMSCVPVGEVLISNVTIGTGDGIQTEFKIPHEGAKDITCSIDGATIIRNRQSEVVPVYDPYLLWTLRDKYSSGSSASKAGVKSEWIPYRDGYIKFIGVYNSILTGIYVYYDSDSDHYYCIPERIDVGDKFPYRNFSCSVSPDYSFVIVKFAVSSSNAASLYKIFNYNRTTGEIGAQVYECSRLPMFTQDMQHLLTTDNKGNVIVSSFERTESDLKLTTEFTFVGETGNTNTVSLIESGTSFIVDGIVRVFRYSSPTICNTYKVDFTAQTATLITHGTFDARHSSANYAYEYTNNVLTIYEFSTGTAIPIYTNDFTGTDIATKSMSCLCMIDTEDRIYVPFYTFKQPYPNSLLVLARDSENTWYEVNTQHKNYYDNGDTFSASYRGVVHQEFTVGNYTLAENMLIPASCASSDDGYCASSRESLCFKRDKDIRLRFATPPAAGVPVIVGYKLDYLPKDTNWVMKTQGVLSMTKAD